MLLFLRRAFAAAFLAGGSSASAAILFEDGFEQGLNWTVTSTQQGRALASTDHDPATGSYHLVLDDAENDPVSSVAEASLNLDLTFKKNVTLNFKAKSLGNEGHNPPAANFTTTRQYDGVAISTDGGLTWRSVQSLAGTGTEWTSYSLALDPSIALLGGDFAEGFKIRFSGYDNAPAPLDGIAIDDVSVTADIDQRTVIELPVSVAEGSGPHAATVLLHFPQDNPLTLYLYATPGSLVTLPPIVVVPAGQTSASFEFSTTEDQVVSLTRTATLSASASGVVPVPSSLTILDNDAPAATVVLPATLTEGATPSTNAAVTLSSALAETRILNLTASPADEVTVPQTVTFTAGQTVVPFTIRAVNDSKIDGGVAVTVTATAAGLVPASATTTTLDNESRTLVLNVPASILEGDAILGHVTISGPLDAPLSVNLAGGNGSLAVPDTVIIAAGQTRVNFIVTATDNTLFDGTRVVGITATAGGFPGDTKNVTVKDNEVVRYDFIPDVDLVDTLNPLPIFLRAIDIEGNPISGLTRTLSLTMLLPDGSSLPLNPASISLSGSGWSGAITLPAVAQQPFRLRATDTSGSTGTTRPVRFMRKLPMKTADLAWDAARNRIYASIPASATGSLANQVVALDPVTLQVTASVATGLDPGQLVLTDDGASLHVAQNANGSISKVDLASMTVASSFLLGVAPGNSALFARDFCTVAGQPDLLVIATETRLSGGPSPFGVIAYDHGVALPARTSNTQGSISGIEPSADPTVFFGNDGVSSSGSFFRLKLGGSGITVEASRSRLLVGPYAGEEIRNSGNTAYSSTGMSVDGTTMSWAGSFGTRGRFCPDPATNRVYCLEASGFDYLAVSAFDPVTRTPLVRWTFPMLQETPGSLIRWGSSGLAFRSSAAIHFIDQEELVPAAAAADLAVTVRATPENPSATGPVSYAVELRNHGPHPANAAILSASLSPGQVLQGSQATHGSPVMDGSTVRLSLDEIPSGQTVTLTLNAVSSAAGGLSCSADAVSLSIDPDFTNNRAIEIVTAGFKSIPNTFSTLTVPAAAILHDPGRNLLWASIHTAGDPVLGKSVVSIDPATGRISDPIFLGSDPLEKSIALSGNGRYLYVGLSDVTRLARLDLQAQPPLLEQIPLDLPTDTEARLATDIEVLDGDGTSVLIAGPRLEVVDGITRRPGYAGIRNATRIERGATAGSFVGFSPGSTDQALTALSVLSGGVVDTARKPNLMPGTADDIVGSGGVLLSSSGYLVNSAALTLRTHLGMAGRPCLDGSRAYLVNGSTFYSFDSATGAALESIALPTTATGDWAHTCLRWGSNRVAILGKDGKLLLTKWTALASEPDSNGDGIDDTWALDHFGTSTVDLSSDSDHDGITEAFEYLFVTSPEEASANPLRLHVEGAGQDKRFHLIYPRRTGLTPQPFGFETSANLGMWTTASGVTETVLSTQTVNNVEIETVEAVIPVPAAGQGFVRLKWLKP